MASQRKYYPWVLVTLCALFIVYKYVLQVYPAVISHDLMREFHLDGAGLGNLVATFFYSYAVVQLFFTGPLLDKLGGRFLVSLAILLCAAGAIGFAETHALWEAFFYRALMGAGVAFAVIGYLKISAGWFSAKQFALISGLMATAAMVGSIIAQYPFAISVEHFGWHTTVFYFGVFGIVFSLLFYLIVRSDPQHLALEGSPIETHHVGLKGLWHTVKKPHNRWLMLYAGFSFSPLAVFAGLWGDPFFETVYHISKPDAALLVSLSFFGLAVGGPVFGFISDRLSNRFGVMLAGLFISFVAILVALYFPVYSKTLIGVALFVFGFGTGAYLLVFALGRELNALVMMATVLAFVNTGDALVGSFTEPLLGKLLDTFGDGKMVHGVPYFNSSDYHISMLLLPAYLIIAALFLYLLKKTVRKPSVSAVRSEAKR